MLDMGFIPDIERICKLVPFTRQTLFFTATMPPEIQRITEQFLHNPVRVEVTRAASTVATTTQALVKCGREPHDKRDTLAPPDPLGRGAQERHHILQPQARGRAAAPLAGAPRLLRRWRCMATWTSRRGRRRSRSFAAARWRCWSPPTWRRAVSTFPTSATCSISTFRTIPTIMSIASAAPDAPAAPAPPSRWWRLPTARRSPRSRSSSARTFPGWASRPLRPMRRRRRTESAARPAAAGTVALHRGASSRRRGASNHRRGSEPSRPRGAARTARAASPPRRGPRRAPRREQPPASVTRIEAARPRPGRKPVERERPRPEPAESDEAALSHLPAFLLRPVRVKA